MKKIVFGLIVFLFPVMALAATTYWVAKDGANGDPGTEAEPWLTIDHAMSTVTAGDTVYVKTGTYSELVTIDNSGSPGAYITLAAASGHTPTINYSPWSNGVLLITGKSYIIVDGINISGTAYTNSLAIRGPGSNIIIRNCVIYEHAGDAALYINGSVNALTYFDVDNCILHDINSGYQEAIRIRQNCRYFKITNNTVYNHSNIGIDCVAWTVDPDNMPTYGLIDGNLVYDGTASPDCGATGIYLDGANHICIQNNTVTACSVGIAAMAEFDGAISSANIIRRNYIYGNHYGGVGWGGANIDSGRTKQNSIYNNTLYGNSTIAWSSEIASRHVLTGNIVKNNIVYDTNNSQRSIFRVFVGFLPDATTADRNCYYIDTGTYAFVNNNNDTYSSLAAWQAAVSPNEAASFNDDPLFVDGDARNFVLQSASPCIDTGGPLADTTDAGTGTEISVDHAAPFTAGYNGLFAGDIIRIGTNPAVTVIAVDIEANTLTVSASVSWGVGDPVSIDYFGSNPDVGAFESGSAKKTVGYGIVGEESDSPMRLFF